MQYTNRVRIFQSVITRKPTALVAALGLFLSLLGLISGMQSAFGLAVTVPSDGTNIIDTSNGAETVLTGYSVTPDNSGDTLLVTITLENAPSGDRLKLTTTTNLTASYGYTSGSNTFSSFTRISFTGTQTNINNAFSSSFKYRSAGVAPTSAPRIKLSATLNTPGLAYFGTTDHFYKVGHFMATTGANLSANYDDDGKFCQSNTTSADTYINAYSSIQNLSALSTGSANCTWSEANRLARSSVLKGRPGYLANITSQEENNFLKDNLNGALNVWMGGSDGTCNGESAYTRLANSFDYMTDTSITDRCSYTRNNVGGTTGRGNYSSAQTGGTEGAFHWYDGPEAGETFWRFYESATWNHSDWSTWATTARERTGYNTGSEDANSASLTTKHDRPSSRYVNWCWVSSGCHEPNNSSSSFTFGDVSGAQGEDNIVFNWGTTDGNWNDLHQSEPTVAFYGYIIEYGDSNAFTGVASSTSTLRMSQTITFSGAAASYSTQTVNLSAATTTSGLTITYSSSDTAICTVNSSAVVTLVSRGRCAITASQAGDTNYLAATSVTQSFDSFYGPLTVSSCPAAPAIFTDTSSSRFGLNGGFETPEGANRLAVTTTRGYTYRDGRSDGTSTRNSGGEAARAKWIAQGLGITLTDSTADVDFGFTSSTISGVSPSNGTRYGEISGTYFGGLYQDITTVGGSQIRWRIYHRARTGTESIRVLIGTASGTTSYSTSSSTFSVSGTFSNATGEQALKNGLGALTNDISDDSSAWNYWEGTYNVPTSQTTTRFMILPYSPGSGNVSSSTGDAQGNLIDQVSFMPTLACPDTASFMEGYAGTSNLAFNDYPKQRSASGAPVETNLTLSTVGTWPTGFTLSGTTLSVANTVTQGTYSINYKISDTNGVESISTATITILPKSLPNLPSVILVDPQVNYVDFPQVTFSGSDNINICIFESTSSGTYLGSSAMNFKFDFYTKGTAETQGPDGAPNHIKNDRTNSVTIFSTTARAQSAFNSGNGLRIYLDSPYKFNDNSTYTYGGYKRYIRIQTQSVATSTTDTTNCPQALDSTSKTIEIRRLGLTTTLRKGTIQLK